MTEDTTPTDLSTWLSTYGALTANRILERFNIQLGNDELMPAITDPLSIYHQLLIIPLKNVFNGIILQQAQEYQLYAQKLFIDYLLSGESGKDAAIPGANTREDLELERTKLLEITESFNQTVFSNQQIISESQAELIKLSDHLKTLLQTGSEKVSQILRASDILKENTLIQKAIRKSMIHHAKIDREALVSSSIFWVTLSEVLAVTLTDQLREKLVDALIILGDPRDQVEQTLAIYKERIADMGVSLRSYRRQFYDTILRATELMNLLPDYRINAVQKEANLSLLYFDENIGGS